MKKRIGMLIAGIAVAVASLGVLLPNGSAVAQEPPAIEPDAPYFYADNVDMPRWLRHSIIVCAAETMDLEVSQVLRGLSEGLSLKEIGIRVGVRPMQLENGILRCEHALLMRLVKAGELEPERARHIYHFLRENITRIINYTWDPDA